MTTIGTVRSLLEDPSQLPAKVRRKARDLVGEVRRRRSPAPVPSEADPWFLAPIRPTGASGRIGPKVVLLNDCRDQVNFGADVLVDGLVSILAASMPTATLLPVPSHWLIDISAGTEAFVRDGTQLRQPKAAFPTLADQFETIADQWEAGDGGRGAAQYLERFDGADLVVLNGEGSIYRTNRAPSASCGSPGSSRNGSASQPCSSTAWCT